MVELIRYTEKVNDLLKRYGVKFGIYKDHIFHEQLFPFDCLPRIITKEEFEYLSEGLIQRVDALNAFLNDVYGEKNIINDNVIPSEFVYSSSGYLPQCEGIVPPKNIYSHISGIDLVQAKDGTWFVLEDNLRVPSGASYPMIARSICRRASPMTYVHNEVAENRNYAQMLKNVMDYVNTGGINAIFTPGRMNAAYFEHAYLAEKTGAILVNTDDVVVQEDYLYFKNYTGSLEKIGALYRRISDDYLDPMTFREDSLIGIPHLMEIYKKGNVALINAPGNGVADDKGIYYFVPKMIEYYLGEKPILHNAPTYLPYYKEDLQFILDNFDRLVIKDVAEAGGYGVFFANTLTPQLKDKFIAKLLAKPRRFIAQEVIDFKGLEILDGDQLIERKADLRAFVLSGETTKVWKSGLTRFSRNPDSFIVNSSQGGGFKDTWILSR
ncbi:circularly permuted type 2 ATP-grasp protein [Megamonas hypermegale]|uniref:circularly permuted type 2 ATP-grasp protein n=1 Tax=Megamonas hypermegale TaxID=158847 RepID=UPI0026E9C350|nr:circularly permuted type 2 ATP-grasp protein [Megamonas hypermegale]